MLHIEIGSKGMQAVLAQQGNSWLQTVALRHLPQGARNFSAFVYTGGLVANNFGGTSDAQPQEGIVVERSDDWLLLKVGRTSFFAIPNEFLEKVPSIGSTVRISPYARRRFDGSRLDSVASKDGMTGQASKVFVIGEMYSELPIDKSIIISPYLKEMVEQVEQRKTADGHRTIAQVLIDAGAVNRPVGARDSTEEDLISCPPALQFHVKTSKFEGMLNIVFDKPSDSFYVQLAEYGTWDVVKEVRDVYFSSLADTVVELVDDGKWHLAKVEILKATPSRLKAA